MSQSSPLTASVGGPGAPKAAAPRPGVALGALVAVTIVSVGLAFASAVPAKELVPATAGGRPGWLLGPLHPLADHLLRSPTTPRTFFFGMVGAFVLYVLTVAFAGAISRRAAIAAVAIANVAFLLTPPLLSQDVFSYVAYARMLGVAGESPYSAGPQILGADPVMPFVGWPDATSVYGPLFTLVTWPVSFVGVAAALWIMKTVAAASVVAASILVGPIARALGGSPARAAILVGMNPLVLVHVVGGAHNDALAVLVALAGLYLAEVARRRPAGGALTVASAGIKVSMGIWTIFLVLGAVGRERWRTLAAAVAAAAAIAVCGLLLGGDASSWLAPGQGNASFYSIPNQVSRMLGAMGVASASGVVQAGAATLFVTGLIALALLVLRRGMKWVEAAGWGTLALLLATPWLMPWYAIWLLPLAAVTRSWPLVGATLALCAYLLPDRVPL